MKGKPKPGISAADAISKLRSDPAYVGRVTERRAEIGRRAAEWRRAELPLVVELNSAGFDIGSAWDLVNRAEPYPKAIPILIEHVQNRKYPARVREGIARALAVPEAEHAWPILAREFRECSALGDQKGAKDGLAAALAATLTSDRLAEYLQLLSDPMHGESRVLLLRPLRGSKNSIIREVLDKLHADPQLVREIDSWRSAG